MNLNKRMVIISGFNDPEFLLSSYGLVAMTADFESASLGSIPSESFIVMSNCWGCGAMVARWIPNPKVASSNLVVLT